MLTGTLIALAGCSSEVPAPGRLAMAPFATATLSHAPARDGFGVTMLRPSAQDGMTWTSNWEVPRDFDAAQDPADPWVSTPDSQASYSVSDGELRVSGPTRGCTSTTRRLSASGGTSR